jgi:hypothetical protein
VVCSLNSVCDLSCGDLCNDSTFKGGRKHEWMTKMGQLTLGKDVFKYSEHSKLADIQGGDNITSGMTITGQKKDVFLLRGEDGIHEEK